VAGQQTSDGGYISIAQSISTDGDVTGNHGQFDYWVVKLNPDNLSTQDQDFSAILMYPNPVKNELYIDNLPNFSSIKITNILGITYLNQNHSETNVRINLETLPQGFYIVEVTNENKIITTKKILVSK